MDTVVASALALVVPLLAAVALVASETLTAPAHAERHDHRRTPSSVWEAVQRVSGCLIALGVAAILALCLVYLWGTRPTW